MPKLSNTALLSIEVEYVTYLNYTECSQIFKIVIKVIGSHRQKYPPPKKCHRKIVILIWPAKIAEKCVLAFDISRNIHKPR